MLCIVYDVAIAWVVVTMCGWSATPFYCWSTAYCESCRGPCVIGIAHVHLSFLVK